MALSNIQLFNLLGFGTAAVRNALIADFLSGDLAELEHMTEDDVKDACTSYAKRQDAPFPIILTQLQRKRFKALMYWVKDRVRAQAPVEFPTGMVAAELRDELNKALERQTRRKEQKKVGESYLDHSFNNKLKSQAQWEKFKEELDATLSMIVGAQGVTLNYVIREDETPVFDETIDYDEAIIQAVPLTGPDFALDAKTVHRIVLHNVCEDSDAYTYIKTLLRFRNGRRDVDALRNRYASDATKQAIINSAKSSLENLRYKNERSFSFERFSSKLQKNYDDLEENGRKVDNGDIVDALWKRIQDTSLQTFIAALKVEYMRNPRDYKLVLQDIAAEVEDNKKPAAFANRQAGVNAVYTREGTQPSTGVHTPDGSIFIGDYDLEKWRSDSVKPYQRQIINARAQEGGGRTDHPSRSDRRKTKAIKRSKSKIKKLKAQLKVSAARLEQTSASRGVRWADDVRRGDAESAGDLDKAGNSFGGRNSKSKFTKE